MIDLHTHSTCSDGSETPARVVELAARAQCRAVALTDHDCLDGIPEAAKRAGELGLDFVAGCEVSSADDSGPLHLLCYFCPGTPGALAELLERVRVDRHERNLHIAARLRELGIQVSIEDAADEAKGDVVGRPHFAAVLVRLGVADSIDDAFERFLKRGGASYVQRSPLPPTEVIEAAHSSGAVVSLAHPLSVELAPSGLDELVKGLAEIGLDGLESYYSGYEPPDREDLVLLSRRHGLVPTGGSDFHGAYRPKSSVGSGTGDLIVPDWVLDELRDRIP